MNIIPKPNTQTHVISGRYMLPMSLCADTGSFEPRCLTAFFERGDFSETVISGKPDIWLGLKQNSSLPVEGYLLSVSDNGISIEAATEQGVIWALTTVSELTDSNRSVPLVKLKDSPKYSHRGLMLDCVRQFFHADEVKRIIEQMSLVKMNVLHWHLTDDQGWRIESKKYPLLHSQGGEFFTQAEIRDIVEFASVRGVEIIPEIDLPGHTTGLLAAYPQYSCFGEKVEYAVCGGIYNVILCPGKEKVYEFLDALLEEVCGLFSSQRFHIGGDEAPKAEWRKCPDCLRLMDDSGLRNWDEVQGHFTSRIVDILKKYKKSAVLWNDALKAENIPKDVIAQFWNQQYAKDLRRHLNTGGEYIFSDMFKIYLDYPHAITPLKKVYNTRPKTLARDNSGNTGLLGIEACMWTEHVFDSSRLEQQLFPRIFAVAEAAWTQERDYDDFLRRLPLKLKVLSVAGIAFVPVPECDPAGKVRRKEAIEYFSGITSALPPDIRKNTIEAADASVGFMFKTIWNFFKITDLPALAKSIRKTLKYQ